LDWNRERPQRSQRSRLAAERLKSAHRTPARVRLELLIFLARGRNVPDVVSVAHAVDREVKEDWLHKRVAEEASHCLGVEVLEAEVQSLQAAGYNVRVCDVLNAVSVGVWTATR
jgi:hypothetical protein